MLVSIDDEQAIEMLVERVTHWTDDHDIICLYEDMYENYVYGGCFDGGGFDVMTIVDNDYVNWCSVYSQGDADFDELLKLYKENGIGDISCECGFASYIEAVDDKDEPTMFLVRC